MAECNIYAGSRSCSFAGPAEFSDFQRDRMRRSTRLKAPSGEIRIKPAAEGTPRANHSRKLCQLRGKSGIPADTVENTGILPCVSGINCPVRSRALKTLPGSAPDNDLVQRRITQWL